MKILTDQYALSTISEVGQDYGKIPLTPLESTDHACEVHGCALLHVDSLAAEDLCDGLGDGEVDDVAHDGGGADLALVQPAVRLLGTAPILELETNPREDFTIREG